MLAQPFTKEAYDLEEFLDHSFGTLIETEVARSLSSTSGKKRTREPAVRFSLSTAVGKRARVYPKSVQERSTELVGVSERSGDVKGLPGPAADPESLAGLDAEEIEALEAMREVQRAQAQAQSTQDEQVPGRVGVRAGSVLTLWSYASSMDAPRV